MEDRAQLSSAVEGRARRPQRGSAELHGGFAPQAVTALCSSQPFGSVETTGARQAARSRGRPGPPPRWAGPPSRWQCVSLCCAPSNARVTRLGCGSGNSVVARAVPSTPSPRGLRCGVPFWWSRPCPAVPTSPCTLAVLVPPTPTPAPDVTFCLPSQGQPSLQNPGFRCPSARCPPSRSGRTPAHTSARCRHTRSHFLVHPAGSGSCFHVTSLQNPSTLLKMQNCTNRSLMMMVVVTGGGLSQEHVSSLRGPLSTGCTPRQRVPAQHSSLGGLRPCRPAAPAFPQSRAASPAPVLAARRASCSVGTVSSGGHLEHGGCDEPRGAPAWPVSRASGHHSSGGTGSLQVLLHLAHLEGGGPIADASKDLGGWEEQ